MHITCERDSLSGFLAGSWILSAVDLLWVVSHIFREQQKLKARSIDSVIFQFHNLFSVSTWLFIIYLPLWFSWKEGGTDFFSPIIAYQNRFEQSISFSSYQFYCPPLSSLLLCQFFSYQFYVLSFDCFILSSNTQTHTRCCDMLRVFNTWESVAWKISKRWWRSDISRKCYFARVFLSAAAAEKKVLV